MATSSEVSLTRDQRSELNSNAQSRSLPAGYVFRAKLILMLAEEASFNTVKRQTANQCAGQSAVTEVVPILAIDPGERLAEELGEAGVNLANGEIQYRLIPCDSRH